MQFERFVRTLALGLGLCLAGFGGGCGHGSSAPVDEEKAAQIQESHKSFHGELKVIAKKIQAEKSIGRKGSHRGQGQ